MIVNGKQIAEDAVAILAAGRAALSRDLSLGIVMSGADAATESFVRIKTRVAQKLGVRLVRRELSAGASTDEAVAAVEELVRTTQGVIVQLPLPDGVNAAPVLAAVPESHDVDAINSDVPHRLVRAPVAEAISEVFARTGVTGLRKKAVVVGAGRLVGLPAAELLRELGAEVEVITKNEGSLLSLRDADIVVLGAGDPGFVRPEMLKAGVVLIDAGTSESSGRLAGDAVPACAEVASVFTPVPGGIGPIAVAMIFKNLFVLARAAPQD